MATDVNVQELRPLKNFGDGCPGCGSILALKLLLQSLDNIIIVNATGSTTPFINVDVPFIHAGLNAASVARGVARANVGEKAPKVVVFAGDGATAMNLSSMDGDILYVCANDFGSTGIDSRLNKSFAVQLAHSASYSATACVSHAQDYIMKLKKAFAMSGFRYVEVLCPCPVSWGYEPSNTIEVGRVAVETGVYPLFDIENSSLNLTKRPNRLEPVERFGQVQKKIRVTPEMQDAINKHWKLLTDNRVA